MALTIPQLLELRLRLRGDAALTAVVDRCLLAATRIGADKGGENARLELQRLSLLLISHVPDPPAPLRR